MSEELTEKQARFVEEYLVDLNATQAMIRAGYSKNGASVEGHRLLGNPKIEAAIAKRQAAIRKKLHITQEMVAAELAKIGFANMRDYLRIGPDGDPWLDFSQLTREQAAAISEVTVEDYKDGRGEDARDVRKVKFKLSDKRMALVDLGKHLGMFDQRVSVQHSGQVEHIGTSDEEARAKVAEWLKQNPSLFGVTGDDARKGMN